MLRILGIVAAALALSTWPLASHAATIRVPDDQPTIQQGLDAASDGDTVLVAPGTYTGALNRDLDFGGVNLVLLSEQGGANTVIDCADFGRAFHFHSGEDTTAVVQGFTIQNAAADSGAGAMCRNGSSPRFLDCEFKENAAWARGGGVCCLASSPVLRDCFLAWNDASGGATSYGGAMACIAGAHPTVSRCEFFENTAAHYAGAIYCQGSAPQFLTCDFSENSAVSHGGGAVFSSNSSTPTFVDCIFMDNTAPGGSAIYAQSSAVTATGCRFWGNGYLAVSFLYSTSTGQLSHCTFARNNGHFHCFDNANAVLSNCTFAGNSSAGGAIQVDSASPTIEDCIIAFSSAGPAASCSGGADPTFDRCVLFGNAGGNTLCGSVGDTLHRDPLFCNMGSDYYALCANSVCAAIHNPWGRLIGALGIQCVSCGSAVEPRSWSIVKSLYR